MFVLLDIIYKIAKTMPNVFMKIYMQRRFPVKQEIRSHPKGALRYGHGTSCLWGIRDAQSEAT